MNKGVLYAFGAYGLWGVLPIYWKLLDHVPALEILMHRTAWSLVFLAAILAIRDGKTWLRTMVAHKQALGLYTVAALLLMVNWGVYIWAVNAGFIVETGLGYYINPLVSVLLGVMVLGERLRRLQWVSVALATVGVLYLTLTYGRLPWIALTLAVSFGIYGLLKKKAPLNALPGLTLETAILTLPAIGYLIWLETQGAGSFGHIDTNTTLLLALTGIATATPLLFFSAAAQHISLSLLGIMQYMAPTIQIIIGVWLYGEAFSTDHVIGFCFIWAALVIYATEQLRHRQRMKAVV
ncbi:MAG: EamA family transporter RarD [Rhodothermales bacterium]